jgi:flagellar biogenesis protein FliO
MAGRPLNQVYQRNKAEQRRFTSGDYLGQVFLLTAAVIILILVMAKMILPRHAPGGKDSLLPFSPTSNNPMAGPPPGGTSSSPSPVSSTEPWLSRLFGGLKPMAEAETSLRPQILFRSRLGPTKDIHVIQVAGKRLVVGSTNHQMTLLTELDSSMDTSLVTPDPDADLYKQYLPSEDTSSAQPPLAGDEEIVILDDYEDTYDTNA